MVGDLRPSLGARLRERSEQGAGVLFPGFALDSHEVWSFPDYGQPILPRIATISSRSKARIVMLRTFPAAARSSRNADTLSTSGASRTATKAWAPTV